MSEKRSAIAVASLLTVASFALYAALAARDVMFGDAPELLLAAATNGVVHPPGYPLWIVLAHAAGLVPIGPFAYRVNLTAGAYHAMTIGLTYLSAYVVVRRGAAALFAAAVLAIGSPLFFVWSLQAEVFSLNDLFAAAVVLMVLLVLDEPRRWKRLLWPFALIFGLGLSNQQTLLMLAPLPLWALWCARYDIRASKRAPLDLAIAAALMLAGFAIPYLHTLLASPHLAQWELGQARTLSDLIDVIDRRVFGSFNLVLQQNEQGGSAAERVAWLVRCGGWPYAAIAAGIAGVALAKRYRMLAVAVLVAAVPLLAFCAAANFNLETTIARGIFARFGLLPLVALAPFSAGVAFLLDAILRDARLRAAVGASIFAAAIAASLYRLPALSLAHAHGPRTLVNDVFDTLPQGAILLTGSAAIEILPTYYRQVEGMRPDVTEIGYGYLSNASYRAWRSREAVVPLEAGLPVPPSVARDAIVRANPDRPVFVVGDRPIHAPGPYAQPLVLGVVSQMVPLTEGIDRATHYKRESALQTRDGYGDVDADFWRTNGFSDEVRAFYAAGFFFAGIDARKLGDLHTARYWFERTAAYAPDDPLVEEMLRSLPST